MVIDGKKIADEIISELKNQPKPKKYLAAFLIGGNRASISFLSQKEKVAKELGVDFRLYKFPETITQDEFRKEILKIISHKTCGGAIVQLPLPEHLNRQYILNVIPRGKDIDILGERALGAFYAERSSVLPPAVGVVEHVLRIMNKELKIMDVVVIGAGALVGKPIGLWLEEKVAGLTVFNENTINLRDKLKNADLIISGVGKANLFSAENLKESAVVIDFGYGKQIANGLDGKAIEDPRQSRDKEQIAGNFNSKAIGNMPFAVSYTPTPGGTGPILVAKLFENFYKLNED